MQFLHNFRSLAGITGFFAQHSFDNVIANCI